MWGLAWPKLRWRWSDPLRRTDADVCQKRRAAYASRRHYYCRCCRLMAQSRLRGARGWHTLLSLLLLSLLGASVWLATAVCDSSARRSPRCSCRVRLVHLFAECLCCAWSGVCGASRWDHVADLDRHPAAMRVRPCASDVAARALDICHLIFGLLSTNLLRLSVVKSKMVKQNTLEECRLRCHLFEF